MNILGGGGWSEGDMALELALVVLPPVYALFLGFGFVSCTEARSEN